MLSPTHITKPISVHGNFKISNPKNQFPNTNDLNYFDFPSIDENIISIHLPLVSNFGHH
jgi:hypothetical protein